MPEPLLMGVWPSNLPQPTCHWCGRVLCSYQFFRMYLTCPLADGHSRDRSHGVEIPVQRAAHASNYTCNLAFSVQYNSLNAAAQQTRHILSTVPLDRPDCCSPSEHLGSSRHLVLSRQNRAIIFPFRGKHFHWNFYLNLANNKYELLKQQPTNKRKILKVKLELKTWTALTHFILIIIENIQMQHCN